MNESRRHLPSRMPGSYTTYFPCSGTLLLEIDIATALLNTDRHGTFGNALPFVHFRGSDRTELGFSLRKKNRHRGGQGCPSLTSIDTPTAERFSTVRARIWGELSG